jgi:hypothetical protein
LPLLQHRRSFAPEEEQPDANNDFLMIFWIAPNLRTQIIGSVLTPMIEKLAKQKIG